MAAVLVLLAMLLLSATQATACGLLANPPVRLELTSRRNLTGHWLAQVTVKHGGTEDAGGRSLDVSIDHRTDRCDHKEAVTIHVNLSVAPPRPGPSYELYPGLGYYKFHTEPKKWREALATCTMEDAHLAIINSVEEATVLKELFARHKTIPGSSHEPHAFLGFHDLVVEGQYITVLGEPLNSTNYVRWVRDQPNNQGYDGDTDADCGGLERSGFLNDLPCNWHLPFFCEQELWGGISPETQ